MQAFEVTNRLLSAVGWIVALTRKRKGRVPFLEEWRPFRCLSVSGLCSPKAKCHNWGTYSTVASLWNAEVPGKFLLEGGSFWQTETAV